METCSSTDRPPCPLHSSTSTPAACRMLQVQRFFRQTQNKLIDTFNFRREIKRKNNKSQSNLGTAASPPLTQRIPLVAMGCPHLSPKLPLHLRRSPFPSNTPIPRPTPLTTPNGIQIQAAVLPQYTLRHADRPTDRQSDRQTDRPIDGFDDKSVQTPAYALLIV